MNIQADFSKNVDAEWIRLDYPFPVTRERDLSDRWMVLVRVTKLSFAKSGCTGLIIRYSKVCRTGQTVRKTEELNTSYYLTFTRYRERSQGRERLTCRRLRSLPFEG